MVIKYTLHIARAAQERERERKLEGCKDGPKKNYGNADRNKIGIKPAKVPMLTRTMCRIEQKLTNIKWSLERKKNHFAIKSSTAREQ